MSDLIFVAELGTNFFGDIDIAKYLIDQAKESGATHVKMQLWKADDLYDKSWEWYNHAKLCELDYDTAHILKEYADSISIGWFSSVHTKEDIDFLVGIDVPFIKIKASQCNDQILFDAINTGIQTIVSVPNGQIESWWNGSYHLYTTPNYPSKFNDIDFREIKERRGAPYVGFSDHTKSIQASLCASMLPNIKIFEKHFICNLYNKFAIDETQTPDYCVSIYPWEFEDMVKKIKHIKGEL